MWQEMMQPLVIGILLGGLYAIIGIGMSMIFGIVKLTNLAHGDLMILASYLSLASSNYFGISPLLSIIVIVPIMFGVGYIMQVSLLNGVLSKGNEPPLLVTFGISIILQNTLLTFFTPDAQFLASSLTVKSIVINENLSIPIVYLVDFVIGSLAILLLSLYFKFTYQGRAIRAASDDRQVAKLMGINNKRIYGIAMGIAMLTAGVAGVLVGMTFNFYPYTGTQYLIISFGVVVIGGLGSMGGTLVAGIILGLSQVLGAHFFGAGLQLLAGYLVLLLMLAFRPQGLFART